MENPFHPTNPKRIFESRGNRKVTTPPISPTKAIDMMIPSENSRKGIKPEASIEEIRSCIIFRFFRDPEFFEKRSHPSISWLGQPGQIMSQISWSGRPGQIMSKIFFIIWITYFLFFKSGCSIYNPLKKPSLFSVLCHCIAGSYGPPDHRGAQHFERLSFSERTRPGVD